MEHIVLNSGWTLSPAEPGTGKPEQGSESLPLARMPMQVADVLFENGKIDIPWKPGNADKYRWIAEKDWIYSTEHVLNDVSGDWFLRCDGLDLFCRVFINGRELARHENTFLPFEAAIPAGMLTTGKNRIDILFTSTVNEVMRRTADMPSDTSLHARAKALNLRKSLCDFNEYLGQKPYFVRMGVFGEISLVRRGAGMFGEVWLDAQLNAAMDEGFITVHASGCCEVGARLKIKVMPPSAGKTIEQLLNCEAGSFAGEYRVSIPNPELWYPVGYGAQPLYNVSLELVSSGGEGLDKREWQTGFRKLEMPSPLHFRVNGADVKLYGGNWAMRSAVTACWDQEDVEQKLNLSILGNYNTMRVWAEGTMIPGGFYDHSDRLGLLIWQDLYRPYTGPDAAGREQNRAEADSLLKSLMHHPGIIIWCGGNESLSFYHWYHDGNPMPGREVLEKELREVCEGLDPSRPYIPESPYGGYDHNDPRVWDTHAYTNYSYVPGYETSNFVSEDFRISAPQLRSLRQFMPENDIWPEGYSQVHLPGDLCEVPPTWLKYNSGFESELKYGPLWDFYDAHDAESMVHRANMAASVFYRTSIEGLRRGRPSGSTGEERCCGGYLAWKFVDSWPQIYGAKIDYFLEPTMVFYFMKRAYDPVQISFDVGNFLHAWIINDSPAAVSGNLDIELFHITKNAVTKKVRFNVSVQPGRSLDVGELTEELETFRRQNILFARLTDNFGNELARTTRILGTERYITFPKATLSLMWEEDGILAVTTDKYAHCVYLEGGGADGEFGWLFDDNYFSLVPGETKHVKLLGKNKDGIITAREFYSGITTELKCYNF